MLRIKNWNLFENSRSKEIVNLAWVPVPNRHDGTSYRELITMPNGPALFGAWVLMVQMASRAPGPRDGRLVRGNGKPHDARSLYAATGCPEAVFKEAIELLISDMEWIEDIEPESENSVISPESTNPRTLSPQETTAPPQPAPPSPFAASSRARAELNGTELNGTEPPPLTPRETLGMYATERGGGRGKIVRTEREEREFFAAFEADPTYPWAAAFVIEAKRGRSIRNLGTFLTDRPAVTPEMVRLQEQIVAVARGASHAASSAPPDPVDDWPHLARFSALGIAQARPGGLNAEERTEFETLTAEYHEITKKGTT
jgi:hypothetical protein